MPKIEDPQLAVDQVISFIQETFQAQSKSRAVIAVSGGIDSAVAATLVTQALGAEKVTFLLLPYGEQSTELGQLLANFNQLPTSQVITVNIKAMVDQTAQTLGVTEDDQVRRGNLMARTRMICVYDTAKKLDALVCGTENKSEHYLGYFTRFGDAASDLEPICQWYKTQVRQVARHLDLPSEFIEQAPSAGLWEGQTDENEMGFSYQQADEVLFNLLDNQKSAAAIIAESSNPDIAAKILNQVEAMAFKRQVPYQVKM